VQSGRMVSVATAEWNGYAQHGDGGGAKSINQVRFSRAAMPLPGASRDHCGIRNTAA
jgi:hypothetical protein